LEALLYETKHLTSFIDAMGDMVRVVTEDGRVLLSNLSFKRTMGDHPREVCYTALGRTCRCHHCLTKNVLKSGRVHKSTRQIRGRMYSVTASPMMGRDGSPLAVIEAFRDVTADFELRRQLLRSNTKMQTDLELARRLQFSLVRHDFKDIPGVKITVGFYPCEAVGGDIYDCFEQDGKVVIYVSDVSGHGVMPAMLAVFVARTIRQICSRGDLAPDSILRSLQNEFNRLDIDDSVYITAFVVTLDPKTNEIAYANAGLSVPPLMLDEGALSELFLPSQPICTWFDHPKFAVEKKALHAGSRLFLYTDGIFGTYGKHKTLKKIEEKFSVGDFNAKTFIENIRNGLNKQLKDDLTLLVCECAPHKS
jgi:sigma-B regulation protein RsbU (phosphoserine phosphatase)